MEVSLAKLQYQISSILAMIWEYTPMALESAAVVAAAIADVLFTYFLPF